MTVSSDATLALASGIHEVRATASVTGFGHFRFAGTTLNFAGLYDIGGSNNFNSGTTFFLPTANVTFRSGNARVVGTVHFNTGVPRHFNVLQVDNGLVTGADDIVVTNLLVMNGGSFAGSGSVNVASGARADFLTGSPSVARTLYNFGVTRCLTIGRVLLSGGVFNNLGVVELHSNNDWQLGAFVNDGSVVRLTGTNTVTFTSMTFTNRGTISVQTGQLMFSSGTTVLEGGTGFSGNAGLRFHSGTLRLNTNVNFGTLQVAFNSVPTMLGNLALANNVGGSLAIHGTMTIPGSLHIAGLLSVPNSTTTVTINGDLIGAPTAVIDNRGTILVRGDLQLNGAQVPNNPPQKVNTLQAFALQIESVSSTSPGPGLTAGVPSGSRQVTLKWNGPIAAVFEIESTTDFVSWMKPNAIITEITPGVYRATMPMNTAARLFFRVRRPL
jgi:hypothetical protein